MATPSPRFWRRSRRRSSPGSRLPDGVADWAPPGRSMVVSSPGEVYEPMLLAPEGRLISLDRLRDTLAARHGASIACPVSTAIFINVAAQAAEDCACSAATMSLRGGAR